MTSIIKTFRNKEQTLKGVEEKLKSSYEQDCLLNISEVMDDGKRDSVLKMPLGKQCDELDLPLIEYNLDYSGKPELALLNEFKSLGYAGLSCEGIGVLTILKALMLDKLAKYSFCNDRSDACTRYLEAQLTILKDRLDEIITSIEKVTKDKYLQNFSEIISKPSISSNYPQLSMEFADLIYDAISVRSFMSLAKNISEDPYTYRRGWPDLTIVKNDEVQFIEIKTKDKLHESQVRTIPMLRKHLPFNFAVYKVNRITCGSSSTR